MTLAKTLAALVILATPAAALTEAEAVKLALDDEYRAYAAYQAVMDKFGTVKPFVNIQRAETIHASMLKDYAASHGITVGANPYLGANLPAAPATLAEACAIGLQAEIDNAGLYQNQLLPAATGNPELTAIFSKLMNDSQQKHLQAFQRCGGGGMGQGHGKGQGMGMGRMSH